jgi:hypothetical protein
MSVGFFDGVGAGESIPDAFDLAVNAIELKGLSGSEIPELLIKPTLLSDGEVKEGKEKDTPPEKTGRTVIQNATGENSKAIYLEKMGFTPVRTMDN